ncbi:MAG TPA: hypothetical protein VFQ61_20520 [Polyangiaceae bacterium]|nr:hypothetical protein [Polyangiaceae bacterium]
MRSLSSSLFVGAVLVFAASCGSDKNDPPPSSGTGGASAGATSSGGASSGGMASTTGATAGGGATSTAGAATAGGRTNVGGSSATGGTAGAGGKGGQGAFGCPAEKPAAGGECTRMANVACTYDDGGCLCVDGAWSCYSDADCPTAAPADAATCTLGGMQCAFDNVNCTCSTTNGWTCESACPSAPPAADAACRRAVNRTCRYAEGALVQGFGTPDTTCACNESKFSCFSQDDCPAAAPENTSACTMNTLSCEYDDRQCTCTNGEWNCVTDCPEAEPSDGAVCMRPENATCRYAEKALLQGFGGKADSTCACADGKFSCFGQEDCPAAAPSSGGTCEFASLACSYTGAQCSCSNDNTWRCTTDCPAAPPAQDAACDRPETSVCRYNDGALAQGGFGAAEALCACRENKFDCLTKADCPATAPANQAECPDLTNLSCSYTDQTCTCGMNGWTCQSECPAKAPAAGAACSRPVTSACLYVAGSLVESGTDPESTCVCASNAFVCYTDADCPAAQPESNAACEKPGLECAFGDQNCRCRTSTNAWSCNAAPPPMGAGGAAN